MAKRDEVRIEYMRLPDLVRWPRNPKQHDLGAIHQSIDRFGFVSPLVLDERTGRLVVGHGRLEALLQKKEAGEEPPARVRVDKDGVWLVPVMRGVAFNSDREAEGYLVADNRLTALGGFNDAALVDVLRDLAAEDAGLDGTGFDDADLQSLVSMLEGSAAGRPRAGREEGEGEGEGGGEVSTPSAGFREVILMFAPDQHDLFVGAVKALRERWGLQGTSDVVLRALTETNV